DRIPSTQRRRPRLACFHTPTGDHTMRMRSTTTAAVILGAGALLAWLAASGHSTGETQAQEKKAEKPAVTSPRPADEKAIRDVAQSLARAFEGGDAKTVAAFWTEEGEYIDEGEEPIRGRAALEKAYAGFFAKRPALKVEIKTEAVRFIGKDAAVEEGTFTAQ